MNQSLIILLNTSVKQLCNAFIRHKYHATSVPVDRSGGSVFIRYGRIPTIAGFFAV